MKNFCAALLLLAGLAGGLLPEAAVAEEKPVVRTSAQPCLHGNAQRGWRQVAFIASNQTR